MGRYIFWDFDNTLAYRAGMWGQVIYELIHEAGWVEVSLEEIRQHLKHGFPWHSPEQAHSEFFKGVSWWEHMTLHFSEYRNLYILKQG